MPMNPAQKSDWRREIKTRSVKSIKETIEKGLSPELVKETKIDLQKLAERTYDEALSALVFELTEHYPNKVEVKASNLIGLEKEMKKILLKLGVVIKDK